MSAAAVALPARVRVGAEVLLLGGMVAAGIVVALAGAGADSALNFVAVPVVPGWIRGPLQGLSVSLSAAQGMLLVAGMALCYFGLLARGEQLGLGRVLVAVVVLDAALALSAPLLSSDVFNYIDYGRLGAVHGFDPYVATPSYAPHDRFFALSGWQGTPSAYGPLFTWLSYLVVQLGPTASLWAFKGLTAVLGLGCVGLVALLARQLGRPPGFAAAAFGLNPVVLVWVIGGAHNDLLMIALLLGGAALVVASREALGAVGLIAAAGVKATGGLALPFLVLAGGRRVRAIVASVTAAGALAAVSHIAFPDIGSHLFSTLKTTQFENAYSIPAGIARLFGFAVGPIYRALLFTVFGATALWQLVRVWRGGDWASACGWAFVALVATSLRSPIWYPVWPLAFAAVARDRRLLVATLAMQTYFVVASLPVLVNWP